MSCPICLEDLKNPRQTACHHTFCFICIKEWMDTCDNESCLRKRCPLCRNKIGVLRRVKMTFLSKNIKIKKKSPPKTQYTSYNEMLYKQTAYKTRCKVAYDNVRKTLLEWEEGEYDHNIEGLWETAKKIGKDGKVLFWHNKKFKKAFNGKMLEFGKEHDEKFLSLIKN